MKLKYNPEKNIYIFECDYSERLIPKNARFRWSSELKLWWTDELAKAANLSDYADGEAKTMLEAHIAEKNELIDASLATEAEIDIPAPDGLNYLPYQRAGIAFVERVGNALIADEMGLGKTIQAIGVINLNPGLKTLIVCPASLKYNWRNELKKWLTSPLAIAVVNSGDEKPKADITIVNYDILWRLSWVEEAGYDLVIADEVHYCKNHNPKNPTTKRSKAFYDLCERAGRKLFLTGTPIVNRPKELYPIISALGYKESFFRFARRYCDGHYNGYGWDFTGAANLEELQGILRSSLMVRRLKRDVLKELPPKIRQVVEIPENGAGRKLQTEKSFFENYRNRRDELEMRKEAARLEDNEIEYRNAVEALADFDNITFTKVASLRRETAVAKVPHIIEYADNTLEQTEKILIFAHHTDVIKPLVAHYGDACISITGSTPVNQRQELVERFQTDPSIKVAVLSIRAAGVGLTLTAADTVIFAELDWTPAAISQAEDRAHRIGQENPVFIIHLVFEGSIDCYMAKTIVTKQNVADRALDNAIDTVSLASIGQSAADTPEKKSSFRELLDEDIPDYTDEQKTELQHKIRLLRSWCDGATTIDGRGFSGFDVRIGYALAAAPYYTNRQAHLAEKLVHRYRKQLEAYAA